MTLTSRHYGLWPDHIRALFIPQIDRYAAVLTERVLPTFNNLDAEAEKLESDTYERFMSRSTSEDPDIASLAEKATGEATDFLVMMWRMKQSQINLQTVGLYHLFEQQLFEIHRRVGFWAGRLKPTDRLELKQVKAALQADDIDIEKLAAWSKVYELSLVANCAKHGEGDSCQRLRRLRPDLLTPPSRKADEPTRIAPDPVVLNPLGGENLYVDQEAFEDYVASLKSFWLEFATALPV